MLRDRRLLIMPTTSDASKLFAAALGTKIGWLVEQEINWVVIVIDWVIIIIDFDGGSCSCIAVRLPRRKCWWLLAPQLGWGTIDSLLISILLCRQLPVVKELDRGVIICIAGSGGYVAARLPRTREHWLLVQGHFLAWEVCPSVKKESVVEIVLPKYAHTLHTQSQPFIQKGIPWEWLLAGRIKCDEQVWNVLQAGQAPGTPRNIHTFKKMTNGKLPRLKLYPKMNIWTGSLSKQIFHKCIRLLIICYFVNIMMTVHLEINRYISF